MNTNFACSPDCDSRDTFTEKPCNCWNARIKQLEIRLAVCQRAVCASQTMKWMFRALVCLGFVGLNFDRILNENIVFIPKFLLAFWAVLFFMCIAFAIEERKFSK